MHAPSTDGGSRGSSRGVLWVAAAALLWSSGGLFIKVAPLPALAVAGGRALVTALAFLLVVRPDLRRARWSTALAYAGMIVTFVSATKMTTAANAIFLQYTGTVWVLALGPLLLGEPFRRIDLACVLVSLVGVGLMFVGRVESGQLTGNVLGAVSGLFFALTLMGLRRDARRGGAGAPDGGTATSLPSTTLGNLVAAAVTLPFVAGHFGTLSAKGLGVLLFLGIVQMALPYYLVDRGLRTVTAAQASLVAMLEPVLSPLWVFLGTGERPTGWALVGGVVVLGAVALRQLVPAPVTPTKAPPATPTSA